MDAYEKYTTTSDTETIPGRALRKIGKKIINYIIPNVPTPFVQPNWVDDLKIEDQARWIDADSNVMPRAQPLANQSLDSSIEPFNPIMKDDEVTIITLGKDVSTVHFSNEEFRQTQPSVATKEMLKTNFEKFCRLYLRLESSDGTAGVVSEHETPVIKGVVRRWDNIIPDELMATRYDHDSGCTQVRFGNIALACALYEQGPALDKVETQDDLREKRNKIDSGKHNLTTKNNVVITREKDSEKIFIELDDKRSILAVRVIEALKTMELNPARATDIANSVWGSMTVDERELFTPSKSKSYEEAVPNKTFLNEIYKILRNLTNKLKLTHEQYSTKFNILTRDITIEYNDEPLTDDYLEAHASLRPVISPGQDMKHLDKAERKSLTDDAEIYSTYVKDREKIDNDTALEMLDFIMSKEGKWALREIAGSDKGLYSAKNALYVAHKYVRRQLGSAYRSAHQERLIAGSARGSNRSTARQIGGRIPGTSKWELGKSFTDTLKAQYNR